MQAKLNKISIEETVKKSSAIREFVRQQLDGLTIGETAEILGLAIARLCVDYTSHINFSEDDMVMAIYHSTAKVLNLSHKVGTLKK